MELRTLNECLTMLKQKGLEYTTSTEYDEFDEIEKTFYTVEIPIEWTIQNINGKTALELNDFLTGLTEDERLRYGIDISNNLYSLHKAGKIKNEKGVWYLV